MAGTRGYASLLQSLLVPSFSEAYVGQDLVWIARPIVVSCVLPLLTY